MATIEDVVLLVMMIISIVVFLIAVLCRRHRVVCLLDEEGVHMAAVLAPFTLVLASIELEKPVFVIIGLCIFAIVAAYYFLTQQD